MKRADDIRVSPKTKKKLAMPSPMKKPTSVGIEINAILAARYDRTYSRCVMQ